MVTEFGARNESALPDGVAAELEGLEPHELREVIHYAQDRLRDLQTPVSGGIQAGPGEDIRLVEERPEYTEVVKSEPCGEGCSDCPHGPYLYHVYEEAETDGTTSLHWVFLGRVFDRPKDAE